MRTTASSSHPLQAKWNYQQQARLNNTISCSGIASIHDFVECYKYVTDIFIITEDLSFVEGNKNYQVHENEP